MKVAVTGANGFIGSRFVALYRNRLEIVALGSENAPLDNSELLIEKTKDVDVVVHCAFDHSYRHNITGIRNLLKACDANKIQKLVHLSSFSVYDHNIVGELNESCDYSTYNDIYTKEKQSIERILIDEGKNMTSIIILQPTVVYGLGGNWSRYAFYACRGANIRLPENGNCICNAVYVDDVAQAIYKSCLADIKFDKFIISSQEPVKWKDFYKAHNQVLKAIGLDVQCSITSSNSNEFHNSKVFNFIFSILFETFLGSSLSYPIVFAKRLRSKRFVMPIKKNELLAHLATPRNHTLTEPIAVTRKVHFCNFYAGIDKANRLLLYSPDYDFNGGTNELENQIMSMGQ
ncbi:NAD(P)-dependent oxidoreductase [Seleniivibrio sp.]|uniref:NAD-dependent epimerase/dehydratase family protein n=1 Tax=Seleniivibrio sp. TaxID=2898801 RepID=UPI0025D9CF2D|nr:NAD(P)-dependent oxidoreductase [Seleniivibrio sp.]MCD8554965.1 NAD(P)-dependent oxidoreductase [Seleniivibrio sp.]